MSATGGPRRPPPPAPPQEKRRDDERTGGRERGAASLRLREGGGGNSAGADDDVRRDPAVRPGEHAGQRRRDGIDRGCGEREAEQRRQRRLDERVREDP